MKGAALIALLTVLCSGCDRFGQHQMMSGPDDGIWVLNANTGQVRYCFVFAATVACSAPAP